MTHIISLHRQKTFLNQYISPIYPIQKIVSYTTRTIRLDSLAPVVVGIGSGFDRRKTVAPTHGIEQRHVHVVVYDDELNIL
jgi:hypothetical protein